MSDTPTQTPIIARRFRGPTASGNGGYSAGLLGALIGDCAQVALRQPPPLDTPLRVAQADGEWQLLDGEQLVASGRALEGLDLDVPPSPGLDVTPAAEERYIGLESHLYPECFVCGPHRRHGDGLCLFTGPVEGQGVVASHWTPGPDAGTTVDRRIVWAALDCPSYFGGQLAGYPATALLGTLATRILAEVTVGERYVVIGWPIAAEGRKWHGGSAIYDADGRLLAYARGTWIDVSGK